LHPQSCGLRMLLSAPHLVFLLRAKIQHAPFHSAS
jgi:hypothetical protein